MLNQSKIAVFFLFFLFIWGTSDNHLKEVAGMFAVASLLLWAVSAPRRYVRGSVGFKQKHDGDIQDSLAKFKTASPEVFEAIRTMVSLDPDSYMMASRVISDIRYCADQTVLDGVARQFRNEKGL